MEGGGGGGGVLDGHGHDGGNHYWSFQGIWHNHGLLLAKLALTRNHYYWYQII